MSLPKKPWETSTSSSLPGRSSTVDSVARSTTPTTTSTVSRPATAQSAASSALTTQDLQGMNSYGGAYGNRYGTTGYGYGTGGYGYGGGYGGGLYGGGMYGGGMYGGGMYGGGMYGGGPMMDPNGGMGWLVSFNQTVGAIGQITQVLGMNAESLNFCFGSFVHFMERMAFLCTNAVAMLSPKPDFPPGHPRYGSIYRLSVYL
ncbi:hypothetical protein AC1031_002064 [Aphanomyces cochlioides]|nr:hypothetical protein AC1031_002064 [Aphanomyces cochlioides]